MRTSMTALKIVEIPIDELHPDPNNARTHDERNLAAIQGSLEAFGQVEPLVVLRSTGRIIGGNGRFDVMKQLGWLKVKAVMVDLEEDKATALALALNRTGELARWDMGQLSELTQALDAQDFDLGTIGWTQDELGDIWAPPEQDEGIVPGQPGASSAENQRMHSIRLTEDQREVFNRAAFQVREKTGDHEATDGRVLELICVDYLAGK